MDYRAIIDFWFEETAAKQWWGQNGAFDLSIRERFGAVHAQAVNCELYGWRLTPFGRLAEIIVIDQFSRNMYRHTAQAFACDALALALAQEAVAAHADRALDSTKRAFLYMPYMHSESLLIHDVAVRLFAQDGMESNLDIEHKHRRIIERFGRYPHRNAALGRTSSAEESAFLKTPGSSF